jgi:hypothetical protein
MYFAYLISNEELLLTTETIRALRPRFTQIELLRQMHHVQALREWANTTKYVIRDEIHEQYTGVSQETRDKMREQKLGMNNPNAKGLREEHKRKIAQTMKKRRGEHHHMWNMKHSARTKMKISLTMRQLPKRRWALDRQGDEHLVPFDFQLPDGWIWGRRLGTLRF